MKSQWITVFRSQNVSDISVLESLFRAHEINFRLLDAHTAGAGIGFIHAAGGVKLQVLSNEAEVASELVLFAGYTPVREVGPSRAFLYAEKLTGAIPFLNRLDVEKRILVLAGIITLVGASIVFSVID